MANESEELVINVGKADRITARLYTATGKDRVGFTVILGHGAGANQLHPFMRLFASGLSERGFDAITFTRRPDSGHRKR